jgi:type I restriction enzyme S subunit
MKSNPADNGAVRDTEIGPIPTDWRLVRLRDVTFEGTDRNRDLEYSRSDVLGVDNVEGLIPSDRLLGDDFSRYKLLRKHQFAYNPMRLNVGSIGLWTKDETAIVSPDYIVFGCRDDALDPDFMDLFRRTATWEWQIRQSGQGSVRIRYYYRHIGEFFVPLPPLQEQRTIARFLRTVQRARETTEKVIAEARQLKQSLMQHLFTYGPVPFNQADHVPLRKTEVGDVPEGWLVLPLGEVVSETQYGMSQRGNEAGRYPILRMNNLKNGLVLAHDLQYVDVEEDEFNKFRLNKGDILFNRTNSYDLVGKTSLFNCFDDYVFASYLIRVVTRQERVRPQFLNYYLNAESVQARLKLLATRGVSQSNINATKLRGFVVPLPTLDEQTKIVHILEAAEKKIMAEAVRRQQLADLFQSLLHQLMTGQVRVHDLASPPSEAV